MAKQDDISWAREKLEKIDPTSDQFGNRINRLARQLVLRTKGSDQVRTVRKLTIALWKSGDDKERWLAVRALRRFGERLPSSFWHLFRRWIESTQNGELRDEISEYLVGALVASDRTWLRVLRHWSELGKKSLRRAGVLAALIRVRQMADTEAATFIAEPLMRSRDPGVQDAVRRILTEARQFNADAIREFMVRWGSRQSSWALSAVPGPRRKKS